MCGTAHTFEYFPEDEMHYNMPDEEEVTVPLGNIIGNFVSKIIKTVLWWCLLPFMCICTNGIQRFILIFRRFLAYYLDMNPLVSIWLHFIFPNKFNWVFQSSCISYWSLLSKAEHFRCKNSKNFQPIEPNKADFKLHSFPIFSFHFH